MRLSPYLCLGLVLVVGCSSGTDACGGICGPDQVCRQGQCVAAASTCGNGTVDAGETCDGDCPLACDDGNVCTTDFYSGAPETCDASCASRPIEVCASGDGCCPEGCNEALDTDCAVGPAVCGDGDITPPEECDDMNTSPTDGCDDQCTVEPGYSCAGAPSVCTMVPAGCGDGSVDGPETCDDMNTVSGDGCSGQCTAELGYTCVNAPSMCTESVGTWIFMGGSSTTQSLGVYGVLNMSDPANAPGARESAVLSSVSGSLWLFGGEGRGAVAGVGVLNDVWEWAGGEWTWRGGSDQIDGTGTYGILGSPDAASQPGARARAGTTGDATGFWIFGGAGFGTAMQGQLGDLWYFDAATRLWTWASGNSAVDPVEVSAGVLVADATNQPGAREGACLAIDGTGRLWLFGGLQGTALDAALWRFDPTDDSWLLLRDDGDDQTGVYGTQNVADPANRIGGRTDARCGVSHDGSFWVYGGQGRGEGATPGALGDLWSYDERVGQWVWSGGSTMADDAGTFGTMGADPGNTPPGREGAAAWKDATGTLWLFGGSNGGALSDVWSLDGSIGAAQWNWHSGDGTRNVVAGYGAVGAVDPTSIPGGRVATGPMAVDDDGRLWMFGGRTQTVDDHFGDLWLYIPPRGRLAVENVTVNEGDGAASVRLVLNRPATTDLALTVTTADATALAGADYTALSASPVTVPAGSRSIAVPVMVTDNPDPGPLTYFTATVSGAPTPLQNTATVRIADDDSAVAAGQLMIDLRAATSYPGVGDTWFDLGPLGNDFALGSSLDEMTPDGAEPAFVRRSSLASDTPDGFTLFEVDASEFFFHAVFPDGSAEFYNDLHEPGAVYTLEVWGFFEPTANGPLINTLVNITDPLGELLELSIEGDQTLRIDSEFGAVFQAATEAAIPTNQLVMLAVVVDDTDAAPSFFYINGAQVNESSGNATFTPNYQASSGTVVPQMTVGYGGAGQPLNGASLGVIRIYERALSVAELNGNYYATRAELGLDEP